MRGATALQTSLVTCMPCCCNPATSGRQVISACMLDQAHSTTGGNAYNNATRRSSTLYTGNPVGQSYSSIAATTASRQAGSQASSTTTLFQLVRQLKCTSWHTSNPHTVSHLAQLPPAAAHHHKYRAEGAGAAVVVHAQDISVAPTLILRLGMSQDIHGLQNTTIGSLHHQSSSSHSYSFTVLGNSLATTERSMLPSASQTKQGPRALLCTLWSAKSLQWWRCTAVAAFQTEPEVALLMSFTPSLVPHDP
jgi:hypothetical protein